MGGEGYLWAVNSFNADLLTVMGVLAGLSALLFLMAALDPTTERRPVNSQPAEHDGVAPPIVLAEQPARSA